MSIKLKSFIQLRKSLVIVLALYLLITILLFILVLVNLRTGTPLDTFTRDPSAIAEVDPFVGVISNIGILFWCVGASVCLFSFFDTIGQKSKKINEYSFFLLFFGLTTLLLLLDDLFLFHEYIGPKILNLSEKHIYICYGIIVLFGIVRFKKIIIQTEWIILGLAFIFFALSIAIDIFGSWLSLPGSAFIEDSFKFLGIASWVSYFVLTSFETIKKCRR